jgi:hypothetical protein
VYHTRELNAGVNASMKVFSPEYQKFCIYE